MEAQKALKLNLANILFKVKPNEIAGRASEPAPKGITASRPVVNTVPKAAPVSTFRGHTAAPKPAVSARVVKGVAAAMFKPKLSTNTPITSQPTATDSPFMFPGSAKKDPMSAQLDSMISAQNKPVYENTTLSANNPDMERKPTDWKSTIAKGFQYLSGGKISADSTKKVFDAGEKIYKEVVKPQPYTEDELLQQFKNSTFYKPGNDVKSAAGDLFGFDYAGPEYLKHQYEKLDIGQKSQIMGDLLKKKEKELQDSIKKDDEARQAELGQTSINPYLPNSPFRRATSNADQEKLELIREALVDIPGQAVRGGLSGASYGVTDVFGGEERQRNPVQFEENQDFQNTVGNIKTVTRTISGIVGGFPTYGAVSKQVENALSKMPGIAGTFMKAHPVLTTYILQNAGEELIEGTVRKTTGQEYGVNEFMTGMLMGVGFQGVINKATMGSFLGKVEAQVKIIEAEKGTTLTRPEIENIVLNTPVNKDIYGRDLFNEARFAYLKGGKKGTPGIDYAAPLPKAKKVQLFDIGAEKLPWESDVEFSARINIPKNIPTKTPEKLEIFAKKYENAEEFTGEIKRVIDKNSKGAFEYDKNKIPLTSDEKELLDSFFDYTAKPEVQKLYESGSTDKDILVNFYNKIKSENPENIPTNSPKQPDLNFEKPTKSIPTEPLDVDEYVSSMMKAREDAASTPTTSKLGQKVKNFYQDLKTKFVDSNAPIEDAIREAQKKHKFEVLPKYDITYQIDRVLRSPTLAGQFMEDNGLAKVIKDAPDLDKLDQYLIAKQSQKVAENGIETGRDLVKDKKLIEALAAEYEPHAQLVTNYSRKILDYVTDAGLISKEAAEALKIEYPDYVPLNRVFSEAETTSPKGGGKSVASVSKQTVVQKLKGSKREIESPLESLLNKTNDAFQQVEKNKAASIIAGWKNLPGFEEKIIPLRTAENVKKRIDIFTALKESRPIRDKVEGLIGTRNRWVRKLQSELDQLNRLGLDAYLKKVESSEKPIVQSGLQIKRKFKEGLVVTDSDTFHRSVLEKVDLETVGAIPSKSDVRKLMNSLVSENPEKIDIIKKKIGTRDKELLSVLDDLDNLQTKLDGINTDRRALLDESRLVRDAESRGKSTISVFKDGIKEIYEVPKEMADAAKNLNAENMGLLAKIFNAPVRIFKTGTTGLEPSFIFSNIVKDQLTAFINSRKGLKTSMLNPVNFTRSLFATLKHDDLYKEVVRMGAGGTSMDIGRDQIKQTIERIRANKSKLSKTFYTIRHPGEMLRTLEDIVGRSEEFTRIQQYNGTLTALLKEGRTMADAKIMAAQAAQQNTANFYRKGDWGKVLNSVPYLNAGIQGSRAFIRSASRDPLSTAVKTATSLFLPMAITTAWNLADPERRKVYEDINDSEKETNFIIIPPDYTFDKEKNRYSVIKIPMPSGVNNLTIPVRKMIEQAAGMDEVTFQDFFRSLVGTVSPVNPIGDDKLIDTNQILSSALPQIIKPAIEVQTNKSLFFDSPVIPRGLEGLSPEKQVKDNTSGTARAIGGALGVSPLQIEHLTQGYLGKLGLEGLNVADRAAAGFGIIPEDQIGGKDPLEAITERFASVRGGKNLEKLYDVKDEVTREKNDVNFDIKNNIKSFVGTKDKEGLKNYLKTLPEDRIDYAKNFLKDTLKEKVKENLNGGQTKLETAEGKLNADEAFRYYQKDIDSFLQTKDKDALKEILSSIDSESAKKDFMRKVLQRKVELGY